MAHVLSITDGTTTKTLADGTNCLLRSYTPKSSRAGEDVTENVNITIQGASLAAVRTYMNDIGALFSQAEFYEEFRQNYIKDNGSAVYINFDPNTSGTTLRSRLKSGRIVANSETLESDLASMQLDVTLEWTRQGFFEGPETEIALASTYNGVGTTGGFTVKNRDDASGQNRVFIPAGQIVGDMPAPLKLSVANNVVSTYIDEIIVGHGLNAKNTGRMRLEAETGFGLSDVGVTASSAADATCSGGNYETIAWTSLPGKDRFLGGWKLSATDLLQTYTRGNRYLVVMRLRDKVVYTDLWLKLRFTSATFTGVYGYMLDGNLSLVDYSRQMLVLDTIRWPLVGTNNPAFELTYMGIVGVRASASATTLNVDCLYFVPISGDNGWMRIKNNFGTGIDWGGAGSYWLTIDPYNIDDFQYYTQATRNAVFSVEGGPITLFPGVWQYLSFLTAYADGTSLITGQIKVMAYYRPRYNLF